MPTLVNKEKVSLHSFFPLEDFYFGIYFKSISASGLMDFMVLGIFETSQLNNSMFCF